MKNWIVTCVGAVLFLPLSWPTSEAAVQQGAACGTCGDCSQPDPPFASCGGCNSSNCTSADTTPGAANGTCTPNPSAPRFCYNNRKNCTVQLTTYTCISGWALSCFDIDPMPPVVSRSFGETAALPDGTFELDLEASVPAGRGPAASPRFLRERSISYGLSGVDVEFREDAGDDPGPRKYLVKISGKVDLDRAGGWGSLWVDLGVGAAHPIGITVDNPHLFSLSPRVLALARGVERVAIEVRGGEGWNSHDVTAVVVPESLGKAIYHQEEGRIYLRVAGTPPRSGFLRISSSGKGGLSQIREIPVIMDF